MSVGAASQQMVIPPQHARDLCVTELCHTVRIGKRRQLVFCDDCLQTSSARGAAGIDADMVDVGSGDWGRAGMGSDSAIGSFWSVGSNPWGWGVTAVSSSSAAL